MSTTSKPKKPSKKRAVKKLDPARPFDPAILAKAKELAGSYSIVIRPEPELGYFANWVEFPYVMADGPTVAKCAEQAKEALVASLATMLENDDSIPAPARDEKRSEQVNIRLTGFEKLRLESLANQAGFRSISDYIRAAALKSA